MRRKSFSAIRNVSDAMEPRHSEEKKHVLCVYMCILYLCCEDVPLMQSIDLLSDLHCMELNGVTGCCALKSRVPDEKRASQDSFTTVAKDILSNNKDVVGLMAEGIQNLSQLHPEVCDSTFVDNFLDQFLLNRIGSNVLLNQYLASIDKSLCT